LIFRENKSKIAISGARDLNFSITGGSGPRPSRTYRLKPAAADAHFPLSSLCEWAPPPRLSPNHNRTNEVPRIIAFEPIFLGRNARTRL